MRILTGMMTTAPTAEAAHKVVVLVKVVINRSNTGEDRVTIQISMMTTAIYTNTKYVKSQQPPPVLLISSTWARMIMVSILVFPAMTTLLTIVVHLKEIITALVVKIIMMTAQAATPLIYKKR